MAARGPLTPTACARVAAVAVLLGACSGLHVSPLAPPPYQADVAARYDATWSAIVRALAREQEQRAVAFDEKYAFVHGYRAEPRLDRHDADDPVALGRPLPLFEALGRETRSAQ